MTVGREELFSALLLLAFLVMVFGAVFLIALLIRQRRPLGLVYALPMLILHYFGFQTVAGLAIKAELTPTDLWLRGFAHALPGAVLVPTLALLALAEALAIREAVRYENEHISAASIKQAMDDLPAGLCCYLQNGRILMLNHAMEQFHLAATGDHLYNGVRSFERLTSGDLLPGCRTLYIEDAPVVVLADGAAWKLEREPLRYRGKDAWLILASDITEAYRKHTDLRRMQEELAALDQRLTVVNRDIVALTAEREILSAKLKIHDELGSALLMMKRAVLTGATPEEREEIVSKLHHSVEFLKSEQEVQIEDEYRLMTETAERLGVRVQICGELPKTEPQKHILAAAIHECLTNTLRHAHGDELTLILEEAGDKIVAVFTNNGDQPREPVREKGGLQSLRSLTESAGGRMEIRWEPVFSIVIELPKEGEHAV
ncbi:MAG: hypothetical protein IK095_06425 [Oscillospiraceae bacterium]|nr:hypothetical protein [Oscillospiraceae bacterium]